MANEESEATVKLNNIIILSFIVVVLSFVFILVVPGYSVYIVSALFLVFFVVKTKVTRHSVDIWDILLFAVLISVAVVVTIYNINRQEARQHTLETAILLLRDITDIAESPTPHCNVYGMSQYSGGSTNRAIDYLFFYCGTVIHKSSIPTLTDMVHSNINFTNNGFSITFASRYFNTNTEYDIVNVLNNQGYSCYVSGKDAIICYANVTFSPVM